MTIGIGVLALLIWTGKETDKASLERQARLVQTVISHLQQEVAHDQESATVWDDAVIEVGNRDLAWIDDNLGTWMHDYFGFDSIYVLDPENRPIYAFSNGGVENPATYEIAAAQSAPLVDLLRAKIAAGYVSEVNNQVLTPGVADLAVIDGRPSIVSVKPIVPHTDQVEQTTGEEAFHVAVRYLDGSLIQELQTDYMFENLRFSWTPDGSNQPLTTDGNAIIGYFVWQPYMPGSAVMQQLIPVLVATTGVSLVVIGAFLTMHNNRSRKLEESKERIHYLALHDPLTDLPNRAHFNEAVDHRLSNAPAGPLALLYLDLDRFKQVNDTLGHPAGDALIREFGQRLREIVRHDDVVARIGGDEFTVMLSSIETMRDVEQICERMIDAGRMPFDIDGNRVFIGVSIGAVLVPEDGSDRVTLLRNADVALYYSKTTGRGRYSFFSEEMGKTLALRQETELALRDALEADDQLSVYYQPIRSAQENRIVGFEALLRWQHPKHGAISPELFIPVAEETGLIGAIGQKVLRDACTAALHWPGLTVAVNVSGVELCNPDYAEYVEGTLNATGLDPRRLELEITETVAANETEASIKNLKRLRENGVSIAIDDFGTGFSSLSRLQSLQIDRIKIDRSFVQALGRKPDDAAIVRAIVDIAHAKGLKTTAEGVETEAQNMDLVRIGCDDLQGFYFSRPVPLLAVNQMLTAPAKEDESAS